MIDTTTPNGILTNMTATITFNHGKAGEWSFTAPTSFLPTRILKFFLNQQNWTSYRFNHNCFLLTMWSKSGSLRSEVASCQEKKIWSSSKNTLETTANMNVWVLQCWKIAIACHSISSVRESLEYLYLLSSLSFRKCNNKNLRTDWSEMLQKRWRKNKFEPKKLQLLESMWTGKIPHQCRSPCIQVSQQQNFDFSSF